MKKRVIGALCALVVAATMGCGRSISPGSAEAEIVLKPLEQTQKVDDISPWVDAVEFVRIADDAQVHPATVTKMLIDDRANAFMMDDRNRVVAVPADGNRLTVIAQEECDGEGCRIISDMALCGKELMVLVGHEIMRFDGDDFSLARRDNVPIDLPCDALAPDGKGGIYLFSAFPKTLPELPQGSNVTKELAGDEFMLYRISTGGVVAERYIPRTDCTLSLNNISQSSCGEYVLRPQDGNHVFYRLTADGIVPAYRVDFGDENIPPRYYFDAAGEDLMAYIMSPYYKMPMELHETASHLFFRVAGPEAREVSVVYDREGSAGIMWENAPSDMQMQILASDGEWFYAVMPGTGGADGEAHGPLFSYVQKALSVQEPDAAGHSYIVKMRFRKM